MFDPLCLRIIWNNQPPVTPYMGFRDLYVNPEPEWPFGRKGMSLMAAWEELGPSNEAIGMLLLDGDVAIDPYDLQAMHKHLYSDPKRVWVAPCRIWPVSHQGPNWVWGHGQGMFSQEDTDEPDMFSFCFTYLPSTLLTAMAQSDAETWTYPQVDLLTWQTARDYGVSVSVARDCSPKHMHF